MQVAESVAGGGTGTKSVRFNDAATVASEAASTFVDAPNAPAE